MKKILVIQSARLGDLIQSVRLIKSLASTNMVHLAVDVNLTLVAKLLYPECAIHGVNFHSPVTEENFSNILDVFQKIKNCAFDYIYNCNFSRFTTSLTRLYEPARVIGLRPDCHSDGGIIKSPWSRLIFAITKNRLFSSLNLVDFWGYFYPEPEPYINVNPAALPGGKGLGVVLSGREERRSLSPDTIARIISIIMQVKKPETIRFFGLEQDNPKALKILRELPAPIQAKVVNLCGKTEWPILLKEISQLDLLLTPDTGTMHLAAFLGTPVMAFFLSSAFCHETGPYGNGHYIWQSLPECGPCLEKAACINNLSCHKAYASREFYQALTLLLKNKLPEEMKLPCGLQLWATGCDEIGQSLKLIAGKDSANAERSIIRDLIKAFLHLPNNLNNQDPEKTAIFTKELFPFKEWALPPHRYT